MQRWTQRFQILVWQGFSATTSKRKSLNELLEHSEYCPNHLHKLISLFLKFYVWTNYLKLYDSISGYMAPEYAMGGIFSMKSDVYSFGILLLEIVSGSKISSIDLIEDSPNLPVYVSIPFYDFAITYTKIQRSILWICDHLYTWAVNLMDAGMESMEWREGRDYDRLNYHWKLLTGWSHSLHPCGTPVCSGESQWQATHVRCCAHLGERKQVTPSSK